MTVSAVFAVSAVSAVAGSIAMSGLSSVRFNKRTDARNGSITRAETSENDAPSLTPDSDNENSSTHSQPNAIERNRVTRTENQSNNPTMIDHVVSDDCYFLDEDEMDYMRSLRCRERNREHARKTRLRKKAHIQSLQNKVKVLSEEHNKLKQRIDECSIASILIGLGSSADMSDELLPIDDGHTTSFMDADQKARVELLTKGSRKCRRLLVDAMFRDSNDRGKLFDSEDASTVVIPGKRHVSWKKGTIQIPNGKQRQLTGLELDTIRRERNRIHAKMTRARKKCFVSTIENTIADLEADISCMKRTLNDASECKTIDSNGTSPVLSSNTEGENGITVTPLNTPKQYPSIVSMSSEEADTFENLEHLQPPMKKIFQEFCVS